MKIDSIKNGIVIDHITAGKGMEIYRLLDLDATDYSVALIKNASSSKMGKKDIIKIDALIDIDMNVLGYVDPEVTVNIIRDGVLAGAPGKTHKCYQVLQSALHYHHGAGITACVSSDRPKKSCLSLYLL